MHCFSGRHRAPSEAWQGTLHGFPSLPADHSRDKLIPGELTGLKLFLSLIQTISSLDMESKGFLSHQQTNGQHWKSILLNTSKECI